MVLELRQQQKQNLSQRMIQSVKILQMTSQELETYVDELALENPAMDVEKASGESIDSRYQDYLAGEQDHYLSQRQHNDDDYDPKDSWNFNTDHGETLADYLRSQIDFKLFSYEETLILAFILDALDEKGYLTESTAFIADRFDTDEETVEDMIVFLQGLEPAGVCARSLSECLQIQLSQKGILNDDLREITENYLELLAKNKIAALSAKLGQPAALVSKYCALIRTLDPKPGSRFYHQEDIQYIIPDVYVVSKEDGFEISLSREGAPSVSVNGYYQKLCKNTEDAEVKEYLDRKISQTEWVRQCILQRQTTMTKVSEEIVRHQRRFFEQGPENMQPLKMSEIAEAIEMHESTISRAIDNKYLQCAWGIFPMSDFFQRKATARDSRAAAMAEENFTSDQVKQALREIIAAESPKKPFSDRILSEKLSERGITISRRTVAKYRDEGGIPDASGRKQF